MGIFKFLRKKNGVSDKPILAVEPLPLQFEISDFSTNKIAVAPEKEILQPEIVAAITVAIQLIMNDETNKIERQPMLRRQTSSSWKVSGIQRVMQVRQ
ncbi:MAG: hypothetical protein WCV63_02550 [Negativicutes bacterium]|jgi:hypothetical protein